MPREIPVDAAENGRCVVCEAEAKAHHARHAASDYARRLVMADLEKIREAVKDKPIEDTVLDVMDVVTGWVSPHRKLEPPCPNDP